MTEKKGKIFLTRPQTASARWAGLLAARGFDSIIEPLLAIEPLSTPRPQGAFQAVFLTSANSLDALELIRPPVEDLFSLPCFCVGEATGEAARLSGFTDVRAGNADSAALARLALAVLTDKTRPLLHICGDVADEKLPKILDENGFTLVPWPLYHARASEDLSLAARDAFAAQMIAAIPVFSPRSARTLVSLIEKNRLAKACHGIVAIGLSQAVTDVLKALPWRRLVASPSPAEEDVLATLQTELSMTAVEPTPPPPPAKPACAPKKRCVLWSLVFLLLLSTAGAVALNKCPWFHKFGAAAVSGAPNIAALEHRLDTLQARLDALGQNPSAASGDYADGLAKLQAQIAQLQNQSKDASVTARKVVAMAMALDDLREAARKGQNFVEPLNDLQSSMMTSDADLDAVLAKLKPYADAPPPTWMQLDDELQTLENSAPAAPAPNNGSWLDKLKALFAPLVSVRPLHDPQFAALDKATRDGDAAAAQTALQALPENIRAHFAAWQTKLGARGDLDGALHALTQDFTAPPTEKPAAASPAGAAP